jgi:SEC-C motif domain protein
VQPARNAEALMRSRYTAFVLRDAHYLRATWHPTTRPPDFALASDQVWKQLRIVATQTVGDTAVVEFIARSHIGGTSHVLHEASRFVRVDGNWSYIDGVVKKPGA